MEEVMWSSGVFWQQAAAILAVGLLFGGMTLFSMGFAAILFVSLPVDDARRVIRRAFPPFYVWVVLTSAGAGLLLWSSDRLSAWLMLVVAISTIPNRQILMPAVNAASDAGDKRTFAQLHGLSVGITLIHILMSAVVLVRLGQ
jgi:hypothetical protein